MWKIAAFGSAAALIVLDLGPLELPDYIFYPSIGVACLLVLIGLPSVVKKWHADLQRLHFQPPVLTRDKYVRPIGETLLERRVIRTLWFNEFFISRNSKRTDCTFALRAWHPDPGVSVPLVLNVIQPNGTPNILEISGGVGLPPDIQASFRARDKPERDRLLNDLSSELSRLPGIQFDGIVDPLSLIELKRSIILSRTNEDSFHLEELLAFHKALVLTVNTLSRHRI